MKKFIFLMLVFFNFIYANSHKLSAIKLLQLSEVIWGMDFITEKEMILTLKNGEIIVYNLDKKKIINSYKIEVLNKGQGGLLDVKISPNFQKDNTIYLTYSKKVSNQGATTLAKIKFENQKLYDFQDILVTKSLSSQNIHFGSRITFDDKGHLFFSIGDRGQRENAQNLKTHNGSILRLNLDGTIPNDNPFIGNSQALDEIYSYGHRNPQGIFYDIKNSRLWEIEHGPRGGDEINLVEKGVNYGWPVVSLGKEYWNNDDVGIKHKEGMSDAKKIYIPSIAPSSLIFYDGDIYKSLKEKLLSGALKLRHINILTLDKKVNITKEERIFENLGERVRNLAISPKGLIYFSTDSGRLYLIKND